MAFTQQNASPLKATHNMPRQTAGNRNTRIRTCRCSNATWRWIRFKKSTLGFTRTSRGQHPSPWQCSALGKVVGRQEIRFWVNDPARRALRDSDPFGRYKPEEIYTDSEHNIYFV